MSIPNQFGGDSSSQSDTPPPTYRSDSPLVLLGTAIGWILLAVAAAVAAEIAISVVTDEKSTMRSGLSAVATSILFYGLMLRAAITRGRFVGQGDLRAGLGDGPVSGWPVLVAMFVLTIGCVIAVVAAYYYGYVESPVRATDRVSSRWGEIVSAIVMVAVAPPIEEFWFRGWLWTGLRKHWSPIATMFVTGVFFIALHLPQTVAAVGHHAAAAVLLSLARYFGGSIRASIALHVIWNFTTVVSAAAFFFFFGAPAPG